jgi:hypothetical protein
MFMQADETLNNNHFYRHFCAAVMDEERQARASGVPRWWIHAQKNSKTKIPDWCSSKVPRPPPTVSEALQKDEEARWAGRNVEADLAMMAAI